MDMSTSLTAEQYQPSKHFIRSSLIARGNNMKLKIPKIAEAMVTASNEHNLERYLDCFLENASIGDVGDAIRGKKAIADWFENKDYEYQMEPIQVDASTDEITLKANVTGTFKGSPMNFLLQMKLDSGLIQNLKITVA
ncbi:MAG: nuclear transport factor 2 family protein [Proteobacteria bacterium]|nr:MAG: nuclear transport factor 2 family protein [Pseudomonadota bacterium]